MKTIATAAVFLALTATAWADEPETTQRNDPAKTNEPIVLSEAEMDAVSAAGAIPTPYPMFGLTASQPTSSTTYLDIKMKPVYIVSYQTGG